MDKKRNTFLNSILLLISSMIFSSCTEVHVHEYNNEWNYDNDSHWHSCIMEDCDGVSDYSEHIFTEIVTQPTFEQQGYTTYTCETCGYSYVSDYTDILKHNYDTSNWSYNSSGHYHKCKDEGYEDLYIDFEEHSFEEDSISGNTVTYKCEECDYEYSTTCYKVTFVCGDGASIIIYKTQDTTKDGEISNIGYVRDGEKGTISTDGTGQINFKLVLDDSYKLDSLSVSSGTYNKIKNDPEDEKNYDIYRITKIQSDLVVNVETSLKSVEPTGYTVSFNLPDNVSVNVYDTQNLDGEYISVNNQYSETIYAKTKNGVISQTGDEQINFIVVLPLNYEVDEVSVLPTNNFKNIKKDPDSTNNSLYYRITKITGNININITIKEVEEEKEEPKESNYELTCLSGSEGCYTVVTNSETTITFSNITSKTVYKISGTLYGNIIIDVGEDYKFELDLDNVTIESSNNCPIVINSGDKFTLNVLSGTTNSILDNRDAITSDDDISSSIYAKCDVDIKGSGTLNLTSTNNNGIHTKDDLEVKEVTLTVTCKDNALKGNDSVSILSGNLTLIASQGDGIKTTNSKIKYEDDGITIKKILGTVSITGGTTNIYAASDGIDASYNVEVDGENAILNIYTSSYSSYTESIPSSNKQYFYLRTTNTTYNYSIYYYDTTSEEYLWKNANGYKKVSASAGGPGKVATYYYYYEFDWVDSYSTFTVYAYDNSQEQGQSTSYYEKSDSFSTNTTKNLIIFSSSFNGSLSSYTVSGSSSSYKGLKADNEVNINNGTIVIKSYDDGIHANNDTVLGDEDDLNDDYYGNGNINISGGNITITTCDDGLHADQDVNISGGTLNILTSYEGIEGNRIYISGGETHAYASDDAMNAAECNGAYDPLVYISGGLVDLDVGSGDTDTIDSNGNITITGGIVILKNRQMHTSSKNGGTIDLDRTLSITGGIILSIGCWCSEAKNFNPNISSSSNLTSGTYTLKDSSYNEVCSFTLNTTYYGYRMKIVDISGNYYFYKGSNLVATIS